MLNLQGYWVGLTDYNILEYLKDSLLLLVRYKNQIQ